VTRTREEADRTRALAAEEEHLLSCVHCGFCLPACPTYVRLGDEADSPRGRLHLMRAVAEGRLDPASNVLHRHLDRCLGCRACEPVCPSGVPYGHLLERAREVTRAHRSPPLAVRILLALLARRSWTRVASWAARLVRGSGLAGAAARVLPRRWGLPFAMLAASAPTDLRAWPGDVTGAMGEGRHATGSGRVALLDGCVQRGIFGHVNRATVRVLRANGYDVLTVPGQKCCGALHAHAGDLEGARALARRNVEAFRIADPDWIGVNAAGCGAALREYGDLLEGDRLEHEARTLASRVRDVSELLAAAGPRGGAPVRVDVAWDPPCHLLHAQRVHEPPLQVLEAIPGVVRRDLARASECCGGAGVYGMTHPGLGGRIGGDKTSALLESGAELVVTANPGCQMQMGAGLLLDGRRLRVVHLVEILDESYRRAGAAAPGETHEERA
jgi:glycolate oxidase iron-sulfur subunit